MTFLDALFSCNFVLFSLQNQLSHQERFFLKKRNEIFHVQNYTFYPITVAYTKKVLQYPCITKKQYFKYEIILKNINR